MTGLVPVGPGRRTTTPPTGPHPCWWPPAPVEPPGLVPRSAEAIAFVDANNAAGRLAIDAERGIRYRSVTVRSLFAFGEWPPAVRP
jgi:hypothetical protein